jgi:myo-inositol-1(or 4)-monophosphatase
VIRAHLYGVGYYGAVMNLTSKIWDNVAPQIIITEAGGLYTDVDGNTIDYSDPLKKIDKNFTYCAAPYALHVQLQEIIKRHNLEVQ